MRIKIVLMLILLTSVIIPFSSIPNVLAPIGAPRLAGIDPAVNMLLANSSVALQAGEQQLSLVDSSSAAGYSLALLFSYGNTTLVTFSGGQFSLYLSKDGYGTISPSDVLYGSGFAVSTLSSLYPISVTKFSQSLKNGSAAFQLGTGTFFDVSAGANVTCKVLVGPIPVNVSSDYKFIKVYDGSLVGVPPQIVNILPSFSLSPASGSAGATATINGTGLPGNKQVRISYISPLTGLIAQPSSDANGQLSFSWSMADLKNNYSSLPVQSVLIAVKDPATNASLANLTFSEYSRVFTLIEGETNATNAGNGTATVNVKTTGSLRVDGSYFSPGTVDFSIGGTALGTAQVNSSSSFSATFAVPPLTSGVHDVVALNNGVSYTFKVNAFPSLVATPENGPVGSALQINAYSFAPSSNYYIYWYGLAAADSTWHNLINFTTGADGRAAPVITVPQAYGGLHNVAATSAFYGKNATSISIYAFDTFTTRVAYHYVISFQQSGIGGDWTGPVLAIDGANYTASQLPVTFNWLEGTSHSYSWAGPIAASVGKRYNLSLVSGFANAQSGILKATGPGTVAASYQAQFQLATQASPSNGGTISPPGISWINSSASVTLTATPDDGYTFANWSGSISNTSSQVTFTMNAPINVIANFNEIPRMVNVTFQALGIGSDIASSFLEVDGNAYGPTQLPAMFTWLSGTSHNFSWTAPITSPSVGKRYNLSSVSGIAATQSGSFVVPYSGGSVTANYKAQYQLTTSVSSAAGGTLSPPGATWQDAGATVYLVATPTANFKFANWSGDLTGSTNPVYFLIDSQKSVTANFELKPVPAISIAVSSPSASLGSSVTISGTVQPPVAENVTIFQSVNGSAFAPLVAATVSNGAYQYTYTPAGLGNYQFKAAWGGSDAYSSTESTAVPVSVTPPASLSDYWLYYVAAVLGIIFVAVIVFIIRSRK